MKRTLMLGGVAVGLLATAAIAPPAHAGKTAPKPKPLAETNFAAKQVAAFWFGENMANLRNAKPYAVETKVAAKHVNVAPTPTDTKAGTVGSSGDQKASTAKTKNVNLPRTSGKVFFIGADHKPHWCSATAVQSMHKNLVATAGHCVYDTKTDKAMLDKWVFVPGYYQGKTPWGIYVGKLAFTHFDFETYADYDYDYAFVTVYNGVKVTGSKTSRVDDWIDKKVFKTSAEALKAQRDLETKHTAFAGRIVPFVSEPKTVIRDKKNKEFKKTDVDLLDWVIAQNEDVVPTRVATAKPTVAQIDSKVKDTLAKLNQGRGATTTFKTADGTGVNVTRVNRAEWNSALSVTGVPFRFSEDLKAFYFEHENGWYKVTFWVNYDLDYKLVGKILDLDLADAGKLGDNVGGQGLAYNQKVGQGTFVFGYPSGSHPDGNHAFTGKTLKYSYGKTFPASVSDLKAEALVGIKSSFTGEGALGSAWLYRYDNAKRFGFLNGVTIGVSDTDGNNRYDTSVSPYFDGETLAVYKVASATPSGKIV
ncbi:trypsin-like serine peptidase [Sphaerimonospora cavernae]|uniref:Trypsin-like serine peptidase n=1 Tax=Sphaerimonospora cavernae TaxID=1740611 RepID=A0ABV6U2Q7_9ACTN